MKLRCVFSMFVRFYYNMSAIYGWRGTHNHSTNTHNFSFINVFTSGLTFQIHSSPCYIASREVYKIYRAQGSQPKHIFLLLCVRFYAYVKVMCVIFIKLNFPLFFCWWTILNGETMSGSYVFFFMVSGGSAI